MNRKRTHRIFVADAQPVLRLGVRTLLADCADLEVCGDGPPDERAIPQLLKESAQVLLVDSSPQTPHGLDLVREAKHRAGIRILAWSSYANRIYAKRALQSGADGFLSKSASEKALITALRAVAAGRLHVDPEYGGADVEGESNAEPEDRSIERLTDRELKVLTLIGQAMTTREVATELGVSPKTIETHRQNIKQKLRLRSSVELAHQAFRWVHESN
ncbi:MAG: response regulator transcription factor [Planctomycetota bacterium]